MTRTDLRAGFAERVGVAFAMAILVGAVLATLSTFIGHADAFVLASSTAATLYALWLVVRSRERRAMVLLGIGWIVAVTILVTLMLGPMLHIAGLLLLLWLMRALYVYRTPIAALLDAGLIVFSMMAGYWALMQTLSPAVATWSTFLVLAVLVRVPQSASESSIPSSSSSPSDRFDRAKAAADHAVVNLSQA